ncbi:MAG: hypothetical protein KAR16_03320 [Bacteroidales bacterium]|nr:hypothetical protein [Bacteroidales bacterium]
MNKHTSIVGGTLVLIASICGCISKENPNCGYNGETFMVLEDREALVRDSDGIFYLNFKEVILPGVFNLLDSIHFLKPCNLEEKYRIDDLEVIVSGEVKENPPYSSHNNYTDFFITKIKKARPHGGI